MANLPNQIGGATFLTGADLLAPTATFAAADGFYAAAYSYNGQTVIAYRGTDNTSLTLRHYGDSIPIA
jgi:hypothetical protein